MQIRVGPCLTYCCGDWGEFCCCEACALVFGLFEVFAFWYRLLLCEEGNGTNFCWVGEDSDVVVLTIYFLFFFFWVK